MRCSVTDREERLEEALAVVVEREERLEEALLKIKQWAEAYPVRVFPVVPVEDLRQARFALHAVGINIDALHADWARRIMKGLVEHIEEALKSNEDDT
jgi:hypothetical protein